MNGRNRVQLAMIMWSVLEKVAADLPGMPTAEMFRRFIAWTKAPNPKKVQIDPR